MIVPLTIIQLYVSNCVAGQQLFFVCQDDKLHFDYPLTQDLTQNTKKFRCPVTILQKVRQVGFRLYFPPYKKSEIRKDKPTIIYRNHITAPLRKRLTARKRRRNQVICPGAR